MPDFTLQQIEEYLNGTLADAERSAFEKELNSNPEFKKEVDEHRLIFEGLKGMEMDGFRKEVANWEEELSSGSDSGSGSGSDSSDAKVDVNRSGDDKKNWRRIYVFFAVVIVSLFFLFLYRSLNQQVPDVELPEPEKVEQQYIASGQMQQALIQPMEALSSSDSLTNQALLFMRMKNYIKAIDTIDGIPATDKNYSRLQLIKGLCYLRLRDYNNATKKFREVIDSDQKNIHLTEEAEWLEVITMILSNRTSDDEIINALSKIKGSDSHKYQSDAAAFLSGE